MNPLSIYQSALDVVSAGVLAGDFAAYAAMIDLPYLVVTETAQLLVTSVENLRPTFDALSDGLKRRGVTHYERLARAADHTAPDRIEGWHHTHLIADGRFVAPSWRSRQVLVRRGRRWLFSEAQYEIQAGSWPLTDAMLFANPGFPDNTGSRG
jgi:hypothetical protein